MMIMIMRRMMMMMVQVSVSEEFLEHCSEGALSVEVYGHRSSGAAFAWQVGGPIYNRVSQKNQKSKFCFATNPTGFHRLDEPPEKFSAL